MSKEPKKSHQNHADWSSEKPSKKASNSASTAEYVKENSKNSHKKDSSLSDHFERYNNNASHNNNASRDNEDYQD